MEEPVLVAGLQNIGNTCYLNSALQCLANQGHFITALRELSDLRPAVIGIPPSGADNDRRALLDSLLRTFLAMENEKDAVRPRELLKYLSDLNPTFESYQQADTAEAILTILASIDDVLQSKVVIDATRFPGEPYATLRAVAEERVVQDAKASKRKKKEPSCSMKPFVFRSVVRDFFEGTVLSTLTCTDCGEVSRCAEPFLTLELHIPSRKQVQEITASPEKKVEASPGIFRRAVGGLVTAVAAPFTYMFGGEDESEPAHLLECFAAHCAEEHLTTANKFTCDHCGMLVQCRRALTFVHLPEVLIIHLKRFQQGYWNRKVRRYVECPPEINLSRFMQGNAAVTYELDGVINHHGNQLSGGHYTAFVNKRVVGWALFNDDRYGKARVQEVVDSEVYVCVYRRKRQAEVGTPLATRTLAMTVLSRENTIVGSLGGFFISKEWLCCAVHLSNPGPITNSVCYCENPKPHHHGGVQHQYKELSLDEWALLQSHYGGGPQVDLSHLATMLMEEAANKGLD
jgi:ubiquitin C-terminal hydrolase